MRRDVFQAIADPVRRDIIGLLAQNRMSMNAVADQFEISRPAISKHIKILTECGLVVIQKQGRERHCEIQPDNLQEVSTWVEQFRALWEARLDRFEDYLEEMKAKKDG